MAETVAAAPARSAARRPLLARPAFGVTLLLVVLAVALAFGSGLGSPGHRSAAARAATIDRQVRCPSCADLSVAESSASAAIAVRHEVARLVRAGRTDQQVEQRLVAQYGPSILLRPPTSGLTAVVWVLPAIGGAVAAGAVGSLLWRRARQLRRLREEGA
ncbi:MAG: cytochrome c-type biogenesis protein CcmH [Acidimicrobiales bacterium]